MDDLELADQKAKEEADAKAKADADVAAAKAKEAEAAKATEEEAKRKAAAASSADANGLTVAQWEALEKQYGLSKQQILAQTSIATAIAQAAQTNGPAAKVVEKDAWGEATKGISDIGFFEADARKAVEAMSPADRQDAKKVRKEILAVRGEKVNAANTSTVRRVSSGLDGGTGGGGGGGGESDWRPGGSNIDEKDKHDLAEVFEKFQFKDKKEWDSLQSKAIPVDETNFVPKFRGQ